MYLIQTEKREREKYMTLEEWRERQRLETEKRERGA
jgi:hypothetical protein